MGLAEPKRKVKYSIDPNALHWANNDEKFGKRMMEKMGWEKGKGLGAKENGMTENIKVRFKSDTKGVGYNNNEYENVWMDHQDDFEKLLSNLTQNNSISNQDSTNNKQEDKSNVQSLEEKSKQSKRLHYKKFAKSKDLSSVTVNDLNCILGSKKRSKLSEKNDTEANDSEDVDSFRVSFNLNQTQLKEESSDSSNSKLDDLLKFNTNKLSINDYFANKMASKLNPLSKNKETEDQKEEIEEITSAIDQEEISKKKKKKKKDKKEKTEEKEEIEIEAQELISEESISKKKKKKKRHREEVIEPNEGCTITITEEVREKTIEPIQPVQDEPEKKKKKKSKKEKEKEQEIESDIDSKVKSSFQGSNILDIYGYSAYYINSNIQDAINEKVKKLNKKRSIVNKKLEIDIDYYKMNKKMNI